MANYNSSHTGAEIDSAIGRVKDTAVTAGTISANLGVVVDANKDISGFRNVTLTGQLQAATINLTGDTTIGDGDSDNITINADVNSNIIPNTDNTFDLGSASKQWKDLYVNGIGYIDQLGTDADPIAIYASSGEIDGTAIGSESASTGAFTTISASGNITGNLVGNVTGNVSGTAATVTGGTQASITSAANLVTVGTIGTGVWQGTKVASAYLDDDTAHLSTTQTFSGAKTFTANPIIQSDTGTLNFYNAAGAQRAFLQLSGTGLVIDTDSFLEFKPNNTTAMYIDSSGNVGVGTTSPNISGWNANYAVLTIKGDTTDYGGVLELANPDSTGNYFGTVSFVNMDGGSSTVANARISGTRDGVDDASALTFETEPTGGAVTERMRINSGGGINVGSGVLTSSSTDGNIVVDEGIYIGTYNGDNQIRTTSAGGGSATLYIGNAAIQVSSDERLKTNIVDTSISALDKINQVRVVDFNWNDPSDTSYNNRNARGLWTGVIAQEIVDVFPFAVNAPRNEEDLSIDNDSESIWQVDQSHLVPTLIKALQEADDKINALTARIEALEA